MGPGSVDEWTLSLFSSFDLQCVCDSATSNYERKEEMVKCPTRECKRYYHKKCFIDQEPFRYGPCYECRDALSDNTDDSDESEIEGTPQKKTTRAQKSTPTGTTATATQTPHPAPTQSPPMATTPTATQTPHPASTQSPPMATTPTATQMPTLTPTQSPPMATSETATQTPPTAQTQSPPTASSATATQTTTHSPPQGTKPQMQPDQTTNTTASPTDIDMGVDISAFDRVIAGIDKNRFVDAEPQSKGALQQLTVPTPGIKVTPYYTGKNRCLSNQEIIDAFDHPDPPSQPLYTEILGFPEPGNSYFLIGEGIEFEHIIAGWADFYLWKSQGTTSSKLMQRENIMGK